MFQNEHEIYKFLVMARSVKQMQQMLLCIIWYIKKLTFSKATTMNHVKITMIAMMLSRVDTFFSWDFSQLHHCNNKLALFLSHDFYADPECNIKSSAD